MARVFGDRGYKAAASGFTLRIYIAGRKTSIDNLAQLAGRPSSRACSGHECIHKLRMPKCSGNVREATPNLWITTIKDN
jgi:hypothetical protein